MTEHRLFPVGQSCGPCCWGHFPKLEWAQDKKLEHFAYLIIASYWHKYQMPNSLAKHAMPTLLLLYLLEVKLRSLAESELPQ